MEYLIRFLVGGAVVSFFAVLAEIFRPKSFAGLFGAAPSIALATIGVTILHQGRAYAAAEARSMIFGALGFFVYACCASWALMRFKPPAIVVTMALLPAWFGVSIALLYLAGWS
jgi:Protein of unknown function (DUF3147)